ncbi:MAG: insulinase family protein [Chitinivibrionales bacterium]|nr:insulinase family protein [Chitinivibrionales bacterium]
MVSQNLQTGQVLNEFVVERIVAINELRSEAALLRHTKNQMRVLHLFNEDANNLFCIGFRTPMNNNTGVAHILEHSVLAGSRKFPLKDPFKELLKGSLQTFLNALTYPDKTIYPVSSQVEKDFFNLVDIYCDAVFNPLLSEVTFSQEGWHFSAENTTSPIAIKGIVYNEMKGVFSDFHSHVVRHSMAKLFPDTIYRFDSGGEPASIPELTYEQFKEFHRTFYHPSNALLFLYGNIPSEKTLSFLQQKHLHHFSFQSIHSTITPQPLWSSPQSVTFEAPSSAHDDGYASVLVAWIFGSATDALSVLIGRVLSHYCFDTESSPLRRALVDSQLGEDLEDMTGFDADLIQTIFCAGLRKTKPEHTETIRHLIFSTLAHEVEHGLDKELLEGSIRQVEFRLREITDGGSFPYNLKLADRVFQSWLYGGDPLEHLCFEKPLSRLKGDIDSVAQLIGGTIRTSLLNNPHNLTATVVASARMGEQLGSKSEEQAALLSKKLTDAERQQCVAMTRRIAIEQSTPPTAEVLACLPKLAVSDLPVENELVPTSIETVEGVTIHWHELFTAGIVYCDFGFNLEALQPRLLPYFPLYSELLTRCGAAGLSAGQMAKRVALATGGINSSELCATRFGTQDEVVFYSLFHGKSLPERFDGMMELFNDLFERPHLDDKKLISDIILEMKNEISSSLVRSGHGFAASHSAGRLLRSKQIEEILDGIGQLHFLQTISPASAMATTIEALGQLHSAIINRANLVVSLTADDIQRVKTTLGSFIRKLPGRHSRPRPPEPFSPDLQTYSFEINASVNFLSRVWRLQPFTNQTIADYFVLSRALSTGYLWDSIRVAGGAYGASASVSAAHPIFACTSYRDPNLTKTLDHFQAGLRSMASGFSSKEVEQVIIGAIGRLDQVKAPHTKGLSETIALLCGRSQQVRQEMRQQILSCTAARLAACSQQLLDTSLTTVTVLGSNQAITEATKQGFDTIRESLFNSEE